MLADHQSRPCPHEPYIRGATDTNPPPGFSIALLPAGWGQRNSSPSPARTPQLPAAAQHEHPCRASPSLPRLIRRGRGRHPQPPRGRVSMTRCGKVAAVGGSWKLTAGAKARAGPLRPAIIRPLLPVAARPLIWVLTVCCAFIVAALPVLFVRHTGLNWLDRSVDPGIQSMYRAHQGLLSLAGFARRADPGGHPDCDHRRHLPGDRPRQRRRAGRGRGSCGQRAGGARLKPLVGRTARGFLSYPSGHGTVMFALAAVLAVLMLNPPGRVWTPALRLIIPAAAVALACVISVIVIGVGVALLHRHDRGRRARRRHGHGDRPGA